jgi:hypothetical protein
MPNRQAPSVRKRAPYRFWLAILAIPLLPVPSSAADTQTGLIHNVGVSQAFFNPSLKQQVSLAFALRQSGNITVEVLDRDGYVIRHLVRRSRTVSGPRTVVWDGRDEAGVVVPDEAYSFKIDFTTKDDTEAYFPANRPVDELRVETKYYDRRTAVLSYQLPKPARVHLQAGTAIVDPRTKTTSGPVLKTLVNREPRPAGAVIENWNGMDESGTAYVPDMPHFVIGIAASSLPENSVITYGNRTTTFPAWAAKRAGTSVITPTSTDHRRHHGLTTLDDVAPRLVAKVENATWSSRTHTWIARARALKVRLGLNGPSAASFAKHPSKLVVYLDQKLIAEVTTPKDGMQLEIPIKTTAPGTHLAALNWASAYGPVAVETIPIQIGREPTLSAAAREGRR